MPIPTEEKDRQFADTLARGLEILRCFRVGETALGNKEFAQRTGLSKPTVARLAYTLIQLGYLRQDAKTRKYRLGAGVLSMGYPLLASMRIRQIARPMMRELAVYVQGAVSLGIRDQSNMVYVESCRAQGSVLAAPDVGAIRPILQTAMGRAWLVALPPVERQAALNQLRVKDPALYEQYRPRVDEALQDFTELGFCISRGDMRTNVHAVAVPIHFPVDAEILVFNCSIEAQTLRPRALIEDIAPRLMTLVRSVEIAAGLR